MSHIYFVPTEDGVDCLIYKDSGRLLARHQMTAWGARVRCTDFEAAVEEALWKEEMHAVQALAAQPIAEGRA